ncbi:MAG TPA: serine/threonine-protein kinase [Candidatus Acidoferrum sp.]|nr:serine/threonine-protein kinase [Candidatus Acidoferrum sp.]
MTDGNQPDEEDALLGTPAGGVVGAERLERVLPAWIFAPRVERPVSAAPPAPPRPRPRRQVRDEELLAVGSIVDKYRVDGLLGKGGFATVYKATHLLLGTRVALKLLRPTVLRRQPALGAQLCAEARFAARINHANVVRILDVTSHALTYIVMEYIDGMSLGQRIRRHGPLTPPALLRVGLQVLAGLDAGLEQGLIHRDIKPANILLTRGGDVKIVDFGLARHTSERADPPRVRAKAVLGTHGYMSPEQADDPETVDFRADVYSLGVTLHEAAAGGLPFPAGETRPRPMPRLDHTVPGFPTGVASLVAWMLAQDRDDRPASYASLHSAMADALATFAPSP